LEQNSVRRSLSKEAWVAVGGIGAAVITGIVTLIIHLTPAAESSTVSTPAGPIPATSTSTATSPVTASSSVIKSMVGNWQGDARDSTGTTFRITLKIQPGCRPGPVCGSIGVSHVPCYGQVFLESLTNDEVEFRVANFDKRSNRSRCQPGAGELFRLRPDGKLAYRTTYAPIAQGVLDRT
jgi:hypothetical protein